MGVDDFDLFLDDDDGTVFGGRGFSGVPTFSDLTGTLLLLLLALITALILLLPLGLSSTAHDPPRPSSWIEGIMSSGSAALGFFWVVLRGAIVLGFEPDEFVCFCCKRSPLAESVLLLLLADGFNTDGEEWSSSVLSP